MNRKIYQKRRRKYLIRRISAVALLLLGILFAVFLITNSGSPILKKTKHQKINLYVNLEELSDFPIRTENTTGLDGILSESGLLIDLQSNEIVAEKNPEKRLEPASLTKIMTVITFIENCDDLTKTYTFGEHDFDGLAEADASVVGFEKFETVPIMDLLYGVILKSGADACVGLANYLCGSEEEFVKLMNQKAEELKLRDTHFMNSHGLHDTEHYTTATDLAVILTYALKNSAFYQIFTTVQHIVPPTNEPKHAEGIMIENAFLKTAGKEVTDYRILGGKTGYTDPAGMCLASLAEFSSDGIFKKYVLITMNGPVKKDPNWKYSSNIEDAFSVYNNHAHTAYALPNSPTQTTKTKK
jgi:D-alanyl-D-alanine carboxypeptidase (penicillin-binding protein 5/6)